MYFYMRMPQNLLLSSCLQIPFHYIFQWCASETLRTAVYTGDRNGKFDTIMMYDEKNFKRNMYKYNFERESVSFMQIPSQNRLSLPFCFLFDFLFFLLLSIFPPFLSLFSFLSFSLSLLSLLFRLTLSSPVSLLSSPVFLLSSRAHYFA